MENNMMMAMKRDEIIFGEYEPDKYLGGIRRFSDMDYETLKELVDKGYADPEESHNDAPSIETLLEFLKEHEDFYVGGYAVSPNRDDFRVSIDTIESESSAQDNWNTLVEFVNMFRFADEFSIEYGFFAWFD